MGYSLKPTDRAGGQLGTQGTYGATEVAPQDKGDGLYAYTGYGAAKEARSIAVPLTQDRHSPAAVAGRAERIRLATVVAVTALFIVVMAMMMMISTGHASVGFSAERAAGGRWVVSRVVPAGIAYDAGVRAGDRVVSVNGVPMEQFAASSLELDDAAAVTAQVERNGSVLPTVDASKVSGGDPLARWGYPLLSLIFVLVGGPVFIRARQRRAASAFFAFCTTTAFALTTAVVVQLAYGWVLALMFVSLMTWAASFAIFFFSFPVPIGTNKRQRALAMGLVLGGAALLLMAYGWVLAGSTDQYAWVQPLGSAFIAACVIAGLGRLGWVYFTDRSRGIRQQLVLILIGTVLAVAPTLVLNILPGLIFGPGHYIARAELTVLTMVLMPLAFAYAITQHQLLGIRSLVRRGVIYVMMGSAVLLVFSLAAAALNTVANENWQRQEVGLLAFGLFVYLVALSFSYVQRRVERWVDRFIYHDAYDYKDALLQFSAQLAAEQNLEALAQALVERTCRLMNLQGGILLLSVDPQDPTSLPVTRARNNTSGLNTGTLDALMLNDALHGQDIVREPQSVGPNQGSAYLLPYVQYGSCADWLLESLQQELSRLGINLRRAEARTRLFYIQTDAEQYRVHAGQAKGERLSAGAEQVRTEEEQPSGQELENLRSFLGVPLWTRSRFVGVLCLGGKKTGERFTKDDIALLSTLGGQAALSIYNAQLYEMREQALLDTITALAYAIEAKDTYTISHCEKITGRAVALAEALGLSRQDIENIRLGSILHDVGKIGIPDAILNKPGKLTAPEYEIIKNHAAIGARIVQSVGALQSVVPIVRHHQERYDGFGYPDRLRGDDIPVGARIIAVVDAYGAMTEDRIYRQAPGHAWALTELKRCAGTQFDPVVAGAFVQLLHDRPDLAE